MSVAFRRESDEEHLESKFELPLPPGPNLVTKRGLAMIVARVADLDAALTEAADDPAQAAIKRDLRYWRARAATATVAPLPSGVSVAFGTEVVFKLDGDIRRIAIVGSDEADPATYYVTFTAPLARAMMGSRIGDCVDFSGNADAIQIVGIEPITT